jgi:hypothetical protein
MAMSVWILSRPSFLRRQPIIWRQLVTPAFGLRWRILVLLDYSAGCRREYYPGRIQFITTQTGYIAPEAVTGCASPAIILTVISADAAGIIATLTIMNWLSWQVADMGPEYARVCKHLVSRQDALKDYISIIHHPERHLIWRAID